MAPLAVLIDAPTRPHSTSTVSPTGAYWSSSTNSTGPSSSSGMMECAASTTRPNGTQIATVPAEALKQALRAASGDLAANTRCMKSIATMSPMPSAIRVAQLMTAPCAGSDSCPSANGPVPSAMSRPCALVIQINSPTAPTRIKAIWMIAVYASAMRPPVPV